MRETVPSPWLSTHMLPSPAARNRGAGPTGIVAVTFSVLASTLVTRLFLVLVIHTEPVSTTAVYDPGGIWIFDATRFVAGSMRDSTPEASDGSHTLPSPAAIPPSVSATPVGIDVRTLWAAISTRHTVPSLQWGTHTLPKPVAKPAHGALPTGIVAATVLVDGSIQEMLFLGLLEIQTPSLMATQSGKPGIGNRAMACKSDMGRCTRFRSGPSACVMPIDTAAATEYRNLRIFICLDR